MRPTCMTIFEKAFSTSLVVGNMPTGNECIIQTDVDITIAFWNPTASAYDDATAIAAPGGAVLVPHNKAVITAVGDANVRGVIFNS